MRKIELLAPAKNLDCGIAAIQHGADAVYIGASRFGARAAAGNSVDDIRKLCEYAHKFETKVYVTLNTIIYENEIETTRNMLRELSECGADAILVQDMAIVEMLRESKSGNRMAIHASTQCDTRSADKVRWLRDIGFERAVLARELSAHEIAEIHRAVPDMELEVFVHGALCVSYSGVCYASEHCFGRSANRGECAQFCRMKFNLTDTNGTEIVHQRHLLSLKDMCRIDSLEVLMQSGASSFKIEGRLKNADYVKNVVAAYSKRINQIIEKHPESYCRSSLGRVSYSFEPNLKKTFNRGFTSYFINGRQPDIASFDTPKAIGEYVGKVKEIGKDSFNVSGIASFANGDGLCFINEEHELEGFRVNNVRNNRLFPLQMPANLKPGIELYRNNDISFSRLLAKQSAERKIDVRMLLGETSDGFFLKIEYGSDVVRSGKAILNIEKQIAQKPQRDNIVKQLTKLGNTIYSCSDFKIEGNADKYFIPGSMLSDLRRNAIDDLERQRSTNLIAVDNIVNIEENKSYGLFYSQLSEYNKFPYLYNISNSISKRFYEMHDLKNIDYAFELKEKSRKEHSDSDIIMQCRYCIRHELGFCVRKGGKKPEWKEPLYLELADGRKFRLQFDCDKCQMNIYT